LVVRHQWSLIDCARQSSIAALLLVPGFRKLLALPWYVVPISATDNWPGVTERFWHWPRHRRITGASAILLLGGVENV
jgi:hypothetical protein